MSPLRDSCVSESTEPPETRTLTSTRTTMFVRGFDPATISMPLNFCIIFLSILTTLNEKLQNQKLVDLVDSYNFGIKGIHI